MRDESAFPRADAPALDALREDLAAAPFTVDAVEELLGPVASAALHREQAVPALRAVAHPDVAGGPLATLVRLFLLGREVPAGAVDGAVPRSGARGLAALGLVDLVGGDRVRPRVDLRPVGASGAGDGRELWWVASDPAELATGGALRADHVLGVGGASASLAHLTVRAPRRRTLDLGTGCGIQALHAATHSDQVVATDVSRRALGYAAFNTALAGADVELRHGSLLDPVADDAARGELFDLVVSNPPFVITPRGAGAPPVYEYRDGGRSGDDLVRDLVTGVGAVLAPGGVAQMLGNWEHRRGEGWQDRVGGWLDGSGLDGWVVQREVQDPARYAETWLRDGGITPDRDPSVWAAAMTAWLEDFASRGVEGIGFGFLVLRRPTASVTLRRLEERTGPLQQPLGDHLAACLEAHDRLAVLTDDALARLHLTVAGDVTEERHLRPGAADPEVVLLRQGGGFGRAVQVGTALAGLVGACDGELSVGQVLGALGALLDVPVGTLAAELLPAVRDLVRDGFLIMPADHVRYVTIRGEDPLALSRAHR